ncbi:YidB family protein [Streptomyces sp. IBSNAI002]|uniref:YidB family protein n=1 Tax=Streptomyces sp. IBSNAI002 TaxID=3457500 RepID=UPI003FD3CC52
MTSLSSAAESWVSTGPNQPITGKEILETLDHDQVAAAAAKAGATPEDVAGQLAEALPVLLDTITPDGTLTDDPALIAEATEAFEQRTPFTVRSIAPKSDIPIASETSDPVTPELRTLQVTSINVGLLLDFEVTLQAGTIRTEGGL